MAANAGETSPTATQLAVDHYRSLSDEDLAKAFMAGVAIYRSSRGAGREEDYRILQLICQVARERGKPELCKAK